MIGPRKIDKPLILYGKGNLGKLAVEVFNKLGIPIYATFDRNTMPPLLWIDCLVAVCVATEPYQPIHNALVAAGWIDIVSVYDIFEAYPECGITSGWFTGELSEEDENNITAVVKHFLETNDFHSIFHHLAFRLWHQFRVEIQIGYDYPIDTSNRYYIPEIKAVFHDHEFILEEVPGSKLADIEKRRAGCFYAYGGTSFYTYMKIHFEGKELPFLEANLAYLVTHRPILAVTCYHNRDGLWKIPKFMMDNLPDYRFLFQLHSYMGQGAVLYAIPKERK